MSILHVVRCEQYEQCKQEFSFGTNTVASDVAPDTWITLFEGNPRLTEGWHFCSELCLARWLVTHGITMPALTTEPQEQPACKARRFLLVDENANIVEGVKWEGGRVTLDPERDNTGIRYYFSWDRFKESYPGSGVQWIDQEAKQEEEKEDVEFTRWNGEPMTGWGER